MAGTSNVSFKIQELGNPVSVAGQGEQAGPQISSLRVNGLRVKDLRV